MSLARLVVTAVRVEGRTKAEVARDYRVSSRWVYECCRRFDAGGEAGLEPRSRRPRRSPQRTAEVLEDEIVAIRKELADLGVDAGAQTIRVHLERRHPNLQLPSVATIWRILGRRGFVTPQASPYVKRGLRPLLRKPRVWRFRPAGSTAPGERARA